MSQASLDFEIESGTWFDHIGKPDAEVRVDGLVSVRNYDPTGRHPEEVEIIEKAAEYSAEAVFFEAGRRGKPGVAQAFIFLSASPEDDPAFALVHQKLWCWGRVPLLYRRSPGQVQLFRCAHAPDFLSGKNFIYSPHKTLDLATKVSADPWWSDAALRNGTLWDDTKVCKSLVSAQKAAHLALIDAVQHLFSKLNSEKILSKHLRRKLLIWSLLIAYLEQREAFEAGFFSTFLAGATKFFEVLANGNALLSLLNALETRFNGHVFSLSESDRLHLATNRQLARFSKLVEGREESSGQLALWDLYSFKDLPVELISHIYQLFVEDSNSSIYTPPFLVRLVLDECLGWARLDRLQENEEIILDSACGSGIFLVEAYKRLILHWRSRNDWQKPGPEVLKKLLESVHGIDLESGAIELAAFSLCLALCDALEPEELRTSKKLFPELPGSTLHHSCFFEAIETGLIKRSVGVAVGNPPFISKLKTDAAKRSYAKFSADIGKLPDRQVAYLFLHESMKMLVPGGLLGMLQQYNFLYNLNSHSFRHRFFKEWDVREVLDFISIRGLFTKGNADTKVVVVVAEAQPAPENRKILHATFRRSGKVDAGQGFDLDYYDLHWISRTLVLENDSIWRVNLLGGGRALSIVDRLKKYRTLAQYAAEKKWVLGEGFIEGGQGISRPAEHIVGHPVLRSPALTLAGIDVDNIETAPKKSYEGPRSAANFTPPMLLIGEHMSLPSELWTKSYLTYTQQIVGLNAPKRQISELREVGKWLKESRPALQAYIALTSPRLFIQKATAIQADDIFSLPYPEDHNLELSRNEKIIVADINEYQSEFVRIGAKALAMEDVSSGAVERFNSTFLRQINSVYSEHQLRALPGINFSGIWCQPYVFGDGAIEWNGADSLYEKLDSLLREHRGENLRITRICRIYDQRFLFLVKPAKIRYWLQSVALRDSDDTLSDLRIQGM
ncbi:N-6 DNA methylase [Rhodoferax sp. 4810]|nr:N-6 DNA methylase [Rhodoferax jenense]